MVASVNGLLVFIYLIGIVPTIWFTLEFLSQEKPRIVGDYVAAVAAGLIWPFLLIILLLMLLLSIRVGND